jgi:gamma-polyglutamate synthase
MIGLTLIAVVAALLAATWRIATRRHQRLLEQLHIRIHVNGIRGKSSVTRLVAAVLREAGYVTLAKTTGSAARVIDPAGVETPIHRGGAATINEQVGVIARYVTPEIEAIVVECMAVNPLYQRVAQDRIIRGDITVITNVREDHQEVMGETLEQIADSMSVTIPQDGVVITAEARPHLRERIERNAARRRAEFHFADASEVDDAAMVGFDYLEFRENVAVGLKVADVLGIDREVAMRGMWKAVPDIGALRLATVELMGKDVLWVPMFAANDRESVVSIFESLEPQLKGRTRIGLLNNRADRGRRAELFADVAADALQPYLDHIVTLGAYEAIVTARLIAGGFPAERVTNLGDTVRPTADGLIEALAKLMPGERAALVGLVNIHTAQAEMLLHRLHLELGTDDDAGLLLSRQDSRAPTPLLRFRNSMRNGADRSLSSDRA